ncbi:MAG: futalosine hydrolase [Thermodesulfovibrionia bacterium]
MRPIAILSSVSNESNLILSRLTKKQRVSLAKKTVYQGILSGHHTILMITGIGKVNASHSATVLIEHLPIRLLINCGVGGAYPESGLDVGDIAIASKEIYGDEGVYGSDKGMREIGIPVLKLGKKGYFNEFLLDTRLLRDVSLKGERIGPFVTISSVSGTYERAIELGSRFNAICENMEGAAIAHVCRIYNIPMLEIRGISNIAGIRDKRRWNAGLASENCQRFVLEVIKSL